ncbi:MAG: CdaR family protein [Desulfuromonadales bacterium]|nr:CdaR family protein [Desulfuromonadales bacterium]MDW7758752.1 CdaR family protein [Desulfuromonadales bacterium]
MFAKLMENWLLKLLSLSFALVLWFFVMGEQKLELGYAVPLELKNTPRGLMVANEVPSLVDVRISGPRTLLMNLSPSDISISVDLKDLQPGLTSFKRLEERLNIPSALKVTRLSPSFVDVKLERIRSKAVPVQPVISGQPAEGFVVKSVRATPDKVDVEGSESELKDVAEVSTEPVDVEGVRESFTLMVPINYRGKYTELKDKKSAEVLVVVEPQPGVQKLEERKAQE